MGALGLGLLPTALSQRPQGSWIAPWRLDLRLGQLPSQYLLGTGAPVRTWLELAGAAAALLAAAMLASRADARERRAAIVAGALAASGLLLALILLLAGVDELISRNTIVVLIPLILLVSAGLGARRAGRLGLIGTATLCTIGVLPRLASPSTQISSVLTGESSSTRSGRGVDSHWPRASHPTARVPHAAGARHARTALHEAAGGAGERAGRDCDQGSSGGWFCWWGSECNLLSSDLDTSSHVPGSISAVRSCTSTSSRSFACGPRPAFA